MYLIIIASMLIVPIVYYIVSTWLGNFDYQVRLNYLTFGVVAVLALIFAFLTVAFHSMKTASTNPVD